MTKPVRPPAVEKGEAIAGRGPKSAPAAGEAGAGEPWHDAKGGGQQLLDPFGRDTLNEADILDRRADEDAAVLSR